MIADAATGPQLPGMATPMAAFRARRRLACCRMAAVFSGVLAVGQGQGQAQSPAGNSASAATAPRAASETGAPRIDLHHHILPPAYVARMGERRIGAPAPNGLVPRWTVEHSLGVMDRLGIAKAVVSISAPGVWLGDSAASATLARQCNEDAAAMVADHPGRFGFFASLPLPDVQAALEELAYALDTLKADGVVLMTNYADRYLGDAAFAPLFEELDRRGAVVFVHPNDCSCNAMLSVPAAVADFPHDTTRAVTSLLYAGTLLRNPRIRFVLSHAGGTLPFLAGRIAGAANFIHSVPKEVAASAMASLRSLYFDTALSVNPAAMAALLKFVPASQVVLGTDYPFAPEPLVAMTVAGLGEFGLTGDELASVHGGTAQALLARRGTPA